MKNKSVTLEQVIDLARQLSPFEKVRLIEQVVPDLEAPLKAASTKTIPLSSAYGSLSELGDAPSKEEIDEMRQDVFGNFPREDT